MKHASLSLVVLAAAPSLLAAQSSPTHPAVGFRGGFTEPAATAQPGAIEVDAGASVVASGDITTYAAGELALHIPVARRLELRAQLNSYTWADAGAETISGRQDAGVGAAAAISTARGLRPAATLVAQFDAPSGNLPGRDRAWRQTGKLALGWSLPASLSLGAMAGVSSADDDGTRWQHSFASVWLGRPIGARVTAFGEAYAFDREQRGGDATGYAAGGLAFRVSDGLQLDVHAGGRLRGADDARTIGAGLKARW